MKTRKLSYCIGLLCLAVLVLMPEITVNAQMEPDGQSSDEQMPKEVGGQGTEPQPSGGEQPPEEQQRPEEQQPPDGQAPSNQEPTQPRGRPNLRVAVRVAEQSLIEIGCQHTSTATYPNGAVWKDYQCPPGNEFDFGHASDVGYQPWICLGSPDPITYYRGEEPIRSGECVPPIGHGGGIMEPTENGESPREVNVKKMAEPASSDSQGEGDQEQANGDVAQVDEEAQGEEAQGEEAQGEGNKASNQSQENDNSKKGYGCSANP